MDKYAELIRAMSEASLMLVKELNEALRRKEFAYDDLCVTYDVLFEEHEKLLDDHEELEHSYMLALDDVDNLTKRLKKYEKEDT